MFKSNLEPLKFLLEQWQVSVLKLFIFLFITTLIIRIKSILNPPSKLSKLEDLQILVNDKDKELSEFIDLQMSNELFRKCVGYNRTCKTKLILDFYVANSDKFSWREIQLNMSKFEIINGNLNIKSRTKWTKFFDILYYVYFGLIGFVLPLILWILLISENNLMAIVFSFILIIPLLISVWMILVEMDKVRAYKKIHKELVLISNESDSSEVTEQ